MPHTIAHIDMDAFFAAVEQRDDPSLKGKPVVIGSDPKGGKGRGVVSTCSYEARKFGVHSAQPISTAYRLCPHAVYLPVDGAKYKQASDEIFSILYDFTPDIEPISIDEAFLDITGSYHFYKTPYATCQKIKEEIQKKVNLTASIGIAPVKMVAKIASDLCKPDGLLEVKPGEILEFLAPLPIRRLWGVGPKTQQVFDAMGIRKIGELAQIPLAKLVKLFGESGKHLYDLSHGIDERQVSVDEDVRSVSHEHTFDTDTGQVDEIHDVLLHLSEKVSRRLRKYELKGKTLSIKIRLKGFKTYTRAFTFPEKTNYVDDIYKKAKELFDEFYKKDMKFRLVGVRVSNFEDLYVHDSLFEEEKSNNRVEKLHKAMDVIKDKFGEESIHRGM
ncbi:MAG: hypothetical protein A2Z88_04485 [Omnitrophica WOR_2 bacterium GWA2_47_8]|nr:MAG: hypothetical protein A2Z88_04485 [Omnitrophica WOR_2 bacterium GWA2_47_8]